MGAWRRDVGSRQWERKENDDARWVNGRGEVGSEWGDHAVRGWGAGTRRGQHGMGTMVLGGGRSARGSIMRGERTSNGELATLGKKSGQNHAREGHAKTFINGMHSRH